MCAGRKGYYSVTFFQQIASIGNNIAIQIVAGISMKAIFQAYSSNPSGMTLQQFIIIFGVVELLLSQMPDIHSLRWLNALCTFCTVGFTVTVIGLSIYACKYAHYILSQMLKSYPLLTGNMVVELRIISIRGHHSSKNPILWPIVQLILFTWSPSIPHRRGLNQDRFWG